MTASKHPSPARKWLLLGLAVLMTVAAIPTATSQEPSSLPDALKDVQPATGECRIDGPAEFAQLPLSANAAPDLNCSVSVSEANTHYLQRKALLIDLRPAADFTRFHIAGALNLTLSDLRSKPYWRDQTLILVGSGKAESEWYSACASLKREGYRQIRVLRGGIAQWHAQGLPFQGQLPLSLELSTLKAEEFWLESESVGNVVVLDNDQKALRSELAFASTLPSASADSIRSVLARRKRELGNVPLAAVVLAVAPVMPDSELLTLQQLLNPLPLLVYRDGAERFVEQMARQKASWKARVRGPKQPRCGT